MRPEAIAVETVGSLRGEQFARGCGGAGALKALLIVGDKLCAQNVDVKWNQVTCNAENPGLL